MLQNYVLDSKWKNPGANLTFYHKGAKDFRQARKKKATDSLIFYFNQ